MPFAPRRVASPGASPTPASAPGQPTPSRRVGVVIWSALVAGVCVFTGVGAVVGVVTPPPRGSGDLAGLLLPLGAVLVAVDLALSYVVPGRMRPPAGAAPDGFALTRTIVASALAVGAALTCCVFFLVSREPLLLALVAPCLAVLAHRFPTAARWARLGAPDPGAPAA